LFSIQFRLRTFIKNTNILDELPLQQRIGVAWGLTDDLAANQTKISSFLRSEERALLQWPLAILLCRSDPTGQWAADLASKFCFAKKNKEGVRPQEAAGQVAVVALCGCFQTTRFINRPVATIQQRPRQKSVAKQDDNDLIPDKGAKRVKKRNRDAVSPSTRTSSDEPAGRKRVKRVAQPVAGGATTAGDEPVTGDLATVAWYSMYGPGPDEWSRVPAPLIQTPLLGRAPGLLAAGASLDLLPLDPLRGKAEPIESPLPTSPFQDVRDDDDNEGDDDSLFGGVRYNADPRDNPGDSEDPTGQHAFVPDNTPLGRLDVDPDLRLSDFSDPESDMDWGESN
jgi:hypothetical protein